MMQGRQAHLIVAVDVYGFAHLGVVQVILRTAFGRGGGQSVMWQIPQGMEKQLLHHIQVAILTESTPGTAREHRIGTEHKLESRNLET